MNRLSSALIIVMTLFEMTSCEMSAYGQNINPRPGLAGEQGVGNPPATSSLPNSTANAPNASPQALRADQPNGVPANSRQNQPNATASEAMPNGAGPGVSQRQYGPRQTTGQYGSDRTNYGSGLMPNPNRSNSDPAGRTMFPSNQRFYPAPGMFANGANVNNGTGTATNNRIGAANGQYGSAIPYGSGSAWNQNVSPNGPLNQNNVPANGNGQAIQRNTRTNGALNSNTPRQPLQADIDGWRFANHNGAWWYWMPGEYWAAWDGNAWHRYMPPGAPTNPSTTPAQPEVNSAAVPPNLESPATVTSPNTPASVIPNFQ